MECCCLASLNHVGHNYFVGGKLKLLLIVCRKCGICFGFNVGNPKGVGDFRAVSPSLFLAE